MSYQITDADGIKLNPYISINGTGVLQYQDGNQSNGYVLTSDASGNASWDVATNTTYSAGSGLSLATTTFSWGGGLTTNTAITGSSAFSVDLGTVGDKLSTFAVDTADTITLTSGSTISLIGTTSINGAYTLPTIAGTAGYVLQTNGLGTASWVNSNTLTHPSISGATSANNSNLTFVQDLAFDTNGHTTGIVSTTITAVDGLTSSASAISVNYTVGNADNVINGTHVTDLTSAGVISEEGHLLAFDGDATIGYINPGQLFTGGAGITISGNTIAVDSDQRGDIFQIGRDTNDYILVNTTVIDFRLDGNLDMRLENDGDLHVDGDVFAFSTTTSDESLKDNVETLVSASEKISKLRGVGFTWNGTSRKGQKDIGLIAQEVEKVIPEVVYEKTLMTGEYVDNPKDVKTVDYAKLVALLIESNKELQNRISDLEEKLKEK